MILKIQFPLTTHPHKELFEYPVKSTEICVLSGAAR